MVRCPETERLQEVLQNTLPESEQSEIVAHLDSCNCCQAKLEEIAVGDSMVLKTAISTPRGDSRPTSDSAYWPALANVERDLKAPLATIDQPAGSGSGIGSAITTPSKLGRSKELNFLDPSTDESKYLGSLDRFQMVEMVGRGGMGMVFRAFDSCLERTVAVKVLDPQAAKNDVAQSRFCREARAAARIAHENVVTIHHVGEVEDRDLYYLVMQFVEGRSLQEILDTDGKVSVREAIRIAHATAAGLAAAHATGLIHRDIKPGNILIETSGRVLLTDFGLARMNEGSEFSTDNEKLTQTGYSPGTPLYMSPEQARGETLDHHTDLFSLGGVLYAMLTGKPPFQGSSPFTVLQQVTGSDHRPIQELNPDVPHSLAAVIDRLLAKNAKDRFHSAAEVATILQTELDNLPTTKPLKSPPSSPRYKPLSRQTWWDRQSPMIAVVLLGLLGVGLLAELTKFSHFTMIGQRGMNRFGNEPETPSVYLIRSDGPIWSVAFDNEKVPKLLATATESGTVKLWDAQTGDISWVLSTRSKAPIWNVVFSKDNTKLVTAGEDGNIRVWDMQAKQETGTAITVPFGLRSVALSPNGKVIVSGARNGDVTFWDAETGAKKFTTTGHEGGVVMAVVFSPDGKFAASTGSDTIVKVWNVNDGALKASLSGHRGPVYGLAFDPASNVLVSAGWDKTVRVWDYTKSEPIHVIDVGTEVWSVAFCPKGKHVLVGCQDYSAKWIDLETNKIATTYRGQSGAMHTVAVSPDGKFVAGGSRDGSVRVWETGY